MTSVDDKPEEEFHWLELGTVEELKGRKCRRLHAASGKDLALFYLNDAFYVTSAICPHAGGPIEQSDIEDLGNNNYVLTCPMHFYRFDLKSGVSATGLKLKTYKVDVKDGKVMANVPEPVTLKRVAKSSCPAQS